MPDLNHSSEAAIRAANPSLEQAEALRAERDELAAALDHIVALAALYKGRSPVHSAARIAAAALAKVQS